MNTRSAKSALSSQCFTKADRASEGVDVNRYWDLTPEIISEAFKRAADIVVEKRSDISPQGDTAFWPAVFLYRHAIEVILKEVIRYGSRLAGTERIKTGHELSSLWEEAKGVLPGPQDAARLVSVDELIYGIHAVDPTGEGFRYYASKQGERLLVSLPDGVSLAHFAKQASECWSLLDDMFTDILEALYARDGKHAD